jgi:signal transduction histidine kinase
MWHDTTEIIRQSTIALVTTNPSDLAERFRSIPDQRVIIFDETLDLVSKIAVSNPNLLCVDLNTEAGLELCWRLQASQMPADIALIAFGTDSNQREAAFAAGAVNFLPHETPTALIIQTINGILMYRARMLDVIGDTQCERDAIKQRYQHYHKLMRTLSDELKNPLSIIYGSLSLLYKEASPKDQPIIDNTLSAVDDTRQILKNLADLNQLEVEAQLPRASVAWLDCLQYCVDQHAGLASERDITLVFVAESEEGYVAVNRHWFKQIITRLIVNAITHSPEGTTVTLDGSITPTQATLCLTDQRDLHRPDGSDLAVIRSVIKQHDGLIWLENRPQHTVTTIKLPVNAPANDPGLRPH